MAEKGCLKRLQKEYHALCKEPPPQIVARPLPNDILEWQTEMAAKISCHHHPSSTSSMAMISSRIGTRQATVRFSTSAHGSNLSFAATNNKQVLEDQLRGIVCYRDEKGEMICEGYDEGPRLGMQLPEKACFPWPVGVQVNDFIQLATLRVFEDTDILKLKSDEKRQL